MLDGETKQIYLRQVGVIHKIYKVIKIKIFKKTIVGEIK